MSDWTVIYHPTAEKELLKLPVTLQARLLRLIDLLEENGPDLGMPLSRPLRSGLYELRAKTGDGIARGIYSVEAEQRVIMLKFVKKKQQRLARHIIDTALQRMRKTR